MTAPADELPATFDVTVYRQHEKNPDLRNLGTDHARQHYNTYGRAEGRICSVVASRQDFLALIPDGAILEIGPGDRPAFPDAGPRVSYLDVGSTESLRETATTPGAVPDIDFLWKGEPYHLLLRNRFDAVFAGLSLERQPCLVSHLTNVAAVLKPGARYFAVLADRRYRADHYLPDTSLGDVLEAFGTRRTRHSITSQTNQTMTLTHDDPVAHWNGSHGPDPLLQVLTPELRERIGGILRVSIGDTGYRDAIAWHFTPERFAWLIDALAGLGMSPLRLERLYPTVRGAGEFYAVLRVVA